MTCPSPQLLWLLPLSVSPPLHTPPPRIHLAPPLGAVFETGSVGGLRRWPHGHKWVSLSRPKSMVGVFFGVLDSLAVGGGVDRVWSLEELPAVSLSGSRSESMASPTGLPSGTSAGAPPGRRGLPSAGGPAQLLSTGGDDGWPLVPRGGAVPDRRGGPHANPSGDSGRHCPGHQTTHGQERESDARLRYVPDIGLRWLGHEMKSDTDCQTTYH